MYESQESAQLAPVNDGSGCTAPCRDCAENTKLLHTILQELRELREGLNARSDDYKKFVMENSDIETVVIMSLTNKDNVVTSFVSWNKFQVKVVSLVHRLGIKADMPMIMRRVNKFAARKFVDFRSQTKVKVCTYLMKSNDFLLSGKKDAGYLSVQDLGKELFQRFSPVLNNQIEQTTVVLSLLHERKLFKKRRSEVFTSMDFWSEFKTFRRMVEEDQDPLKWERLMTREEKRIERYQKLLCEFIFSMLHFYN
ncbi:uncharacterized protein LOC125681515 [Ostrea edulis]|uniref:uncharacterized protein LOC125681515 n=1 Tax=Ostrea edulis TaxID=37623 RepID=UPI0024AFD20D|nr:uncharacterized protein LOC125681515 [Ostrea edulis]